MPRRALRPGIRTSPRWNSVSRDAQALYVAILTLADDYGRYDGRPSVLWADAFAVWNEQQPQFAVSSQQVPVLCQQLAAGKLIEFYAVNGRQYLQVVQWEERVRGTSRWPEPPAVIPPRVADSQPQPVNNSPQLADIPPRVAADSKPHIDTPPQLDSTFPPPTPPPPPTPSPPPPLSAPPTSPPEPPPETAGGRQGDISGGSQHRRPKSVEEVVTKGKFIGVPEQACRDWFRDCEACNWTRGDGTPFDNWPRQLVIHRDKTAGRGPNGAPARPLSSFDLKNIIAAKESLIAQLKMKSCSEGAMGNTWTNEEDRLKCSALRKEIKELTAKLGAMA